MSKLHEREHKPDHSGDSKYACPSRDKIFTYASQLRQHEVKHTGESRYSCQF